MDTPQDLHVSQILQEITGKENWYKKVFDDTIVSKWREECGLGSDFDFAIRLLQATTQGSKMSDKCDWPEDCICVECSNLLNLKLKDVGFLKTHDIDPDDTEDVYDDAINDADQLFNYVGACNHIRCTCISPDSMLSDYIIHKDNNELNNELLEVIYEMCENEPVDYHPQSNFQVRDIIHPSVNCYIAGVTKFKDGTISKELPESERYAWLPAEFDINDKAVLKSRINNLNSEKYPAFIPLIEQLLFKHIEELEHVTKKKLKNRRIQVICKVARIELDETKPNYDGGSWHIEGMPHERIVATVIEYLEVTNITDSYLEFRKPVIINEENLDYPQSDADYTEHHYGVTDHHDGFMNRYLGLIKCTEDSYVIFPNSLQHRVKEFKLEEGKDKGTRTIVALFLVDPDSRIISTEDITETPLSQEEINFHRERLMYHRKYFVNKLNEEVFERPYSLCEH